MVWCISFPFKAQRISSPSELWPMVQTAGEGNESFWTSFSKWIYVLLWSFQGVRGSQMVEQQGQLTCPHQVCRGQLSGIRHFTHGSFSKYSLRKGDREGQTLALGHTSRPRVMKKTPHGRPKAFPQDCETVCRNTFWVWSSLHCGIYIQTQNSLHLTSIKYEAVFHMSPRPLLSSWWRPKKVLCWLLRSTA